MVWSPAARALEVNSATPEPFTGTVPSTVLPSVNCTDPVGWPPPASGTTSAAKLAGCPAACGLVSPNTSVSVDAARGCTVSEAGVDPLPAKLLLPP